MMRKSLRIAAWILAGILLLLVSLVIYLRNADLSVYDETIESYASRAIGHQLSIEGLFELHVGSKTWLVAEDVYLRNPAWTDDPELLRVGHLTVEIDLWSLWNGPFIVERLEVRDIDARILVDGAGRANWMPAKARPESSGGGAFDVNRVAFHNVDVAGVSLTWRDPARPRPLDVRVATLHVAPDASDVLDIAMAGTANDMVLMASGELGPWQNFLDGRDIAADLDVTLGPVRLLLQGAAKDLVTLSGLSFSAQLTGPEVGPVIDRLGLPPFTSGAFALGASVAEADSGQSVVVSGKLGDIDVHVDGALDRFIGARTARLDLRIAGPDTRHVAELFGISGLPTAPFRVAGNLDWLDTEVNFSDVELAIGKNVISGNGNLRLGDGLPDGRVQLAALGPDFSVVGPFLKRSGLPAAAFNVTVDVLKQGDNWTINSFDAGVGENRLAASGSVTVGERVDNWIDFRVSGPDVSFLQDFTELRGLPKRPFEVAARISSDPGGIGVENGYGKFGDNRIDVDGVVAKRPGLVGSKLDVKLSGRELRDIVLLAGVPHLPAGPFDASASLTFLEDMLRFDDARAVVGDLEATAAGSAGLGGRAGYVNIDFTARGPDATQFVSFDWLAPFAGESFSVAGGIERKAADALELRELRLDMAGYHVAADGTLSMSPVSNDSDLGFSLGGPSLRRIGAMFGVDRLTQKSFEATGAFQGAALGFEVRDMAARVGNSNLQGWFGVDLRSKPRVQGRLTSELLDLRERLQVLREEMAEAEPADEKQSPYLFSRDPIDASSLQYANLDVDIYVGELRTLTLNVNDFRVGITLDDGHLTVDPFSAAGRAGQVDGTFDFTPGEMGHEIDLALSVQDLYVGQPASEELDITTLPPLNGQLTLRGTGISVHDIMKSSVGKISARQGSGTVKKLLVSMFFGDVMLEILRAINPLDQNRPFGRVDCGIYEVSIAEGIASLNSVAMQTDRLLLLASGAVNLDSEQLNITFRAKPRQGLGISMGTLANSILSVRGTLKEPRVVIDPKASMTTTGAAVATGGISLLARGLWDRLSAEESICTPEDGTERR